MESFPKFILSWALTVYPLATVVGKAVRRRCATQGEAAREKATSEFFSQPAPARRHQQSRAKVFISSLRVIQKCRYFVRSTQSGSTDTHSC